MTSTRKNGNERRFISTYGNRRPSTPCSCGRSEWWEERVDGWTGRQLDRKVGRLGMDECVCGPGEDGRAECRQTGEWTERGGWADRRTGGAIDGWEICQMNGRSGGRTDDQTGGRIGRRTDRRVDGEWGEEVDGWTDGRTEDVMDGWTDGRWDGQMHGRMDGQRWKEKQADKLGCKCAGGARRNM